MPYIDIKKTDKNFKLTTSSHFYGLPNPFSELFPVADVNKKVN